MGTNRKMIKRDFLQPYRENESFGVPHGCPGLPERRCLETVALTSRHSTFTGYPTDCVPAAMAWTTNHDGECPRSPTATRRNWRRQNPTRPGWPRFGKDHDACGPIRAFGEAGARPSPHSGIDLHQEGRGRNEVPHRGRARAAIRGRPERRDVSRLRLST